MCYSELQAQEKGRSSAGEQQMQRSKDIADARRPAGFRAHDAAPVNWDEDAAEQLVGESSTVVSMCNALKSL